MMNLSAVRGAALLEVVVSIAVLSIAGSAMMMSLADGLAAQRTMAAREAEMQAMQRVMTATSLLTRRELEGRLGRHRVGEFAVQVSQLDSAFFQIAVAEPGATRPSLMTYVFRGRVP